ncbi:unnamed protein product [Rhizophagus irregularis]|nr:unnamed protein product [Rhizophagus irregularis]
MNDVVNEIFLLGKVDIHPNIIKLCEVSKFISKVVNENIGIIVATKLNNSLEIRIINGKREIPIPNTNSEYVKFYKRCWEFEPENLGNSFYS